MTRQTRPLISVSDLAAYAEDPKRFAREGNRTRDPAAAAAGTRSHDRLASRARRQAPGHVVLAIAIAAFAAYILWAYLS